MWLLEGTGLYSLFVWLLYQTPWLFTGLPVFLFLWRQYLGKQKLQKRKQQLAEHFLLAMQSFISALRAGYAAENALAEACRDMHHLFGEEDDIVRELENMNTGISLSIPIEELLRDLGQRSGLEDIRDFAEIFRLGKRSGGAMGVLLSEVVSHLRRKLEMQKDIRAQAAAKLAEQRIMSLMPWGILGYMKLSSPAYMAPLYTTWAGRGVMTVCLGLYLASWYLSLRLCRSFTENL